MGSGPSNAEGRVLRAMAAPPLGADDPAFARLLEDLSALLRAAFQGPSAFTLAVPGASRAGVEAALASLVEPGDHVVVATYGHFGELLCTLALRHGARVERVQAEWGRCVDPEDVIGAVRRAQPKLVAIVHADTSTGVLQPLAEIGRACRAAGSLLLVDAVLSLGGCEVSVEDWALDATVGGMQKCLGGPPGLAPVALSARATDALNARASSAHSAYLDLRRLVSVWQRPADAEHSTAMLSALREALRMIDEEGLAARWRRHACASGALRAGLEAMGLRRFGDSAVLAPMITLVEVPAAVDEAKVRQQLLEQHGVEIMAAFGPLRGRVWRIGTMGSNAQLASVLQVLLALEAVLSAHGLAVPRGLAVDAALAAYAQTTTMRR
ncbi:MAG: alanine--glyoxylate aminotransferase family protein [Chloroflexota bacterium]|nr:alanine--glyoxylate aminotransferase family protein [Chloroflexota bacterium]